MTSKRVGKGHEYLTSMSAFNYVAAKINHSSSEDLTECSNLSIAPIHRLEVVPVGFQSYRLVTVKLLDHRHDGDGYPRTLFVFGSSCYCCKEG